ncbi:MAG: TonB-dependent receptor [Bacteroidaceae bacterium]|nr:TonB-dependent receptor [Bacteroidaceae bacterium]
MVTQAEEMAMDSIADTQELSEVVVSGNMKQFGSLEEQPMSAQDLSVRRLRRNGMEGLKPMSQMVPNLFYPEYGSRLTPAIYIRGIGSRANTPVVGLYVDDVALMEKSSFDFSLADAERVEVLRGPQSTLYGRNAMGGVMKVYTANPLQEGKATEFRLGASTKDAMRSGYIHHSNLLTESLGLAFTGFYRGDNGYNRNVFLNRRSNGSEAGGGKLRLAYKRRPRFSLDFQTSGEYSDEDSYDYMNTTNGRIESGFLGGYRRTLLNSSLKMETEQRRFTFSSVTAYQYLKDRMTMDQDYSPADLFRLQQRQRSHSISEEFVFKGSTSRLSSLASHLSLDWTAGGYLAYQSLKTNAPVTFGQEGIQQLIQAGIDQGFAAANAAMAPMGMSLALNITDPQLVVAGEFDTPLLNAAAFGQLCLKNIFTRGLDLTAGVRLDYEHHTIDYLTGGTVHSTFAMMRGGATMMNQDFATYSGYEGRMKDNQTRLLPKLVLSYRFGKNVPSSIIYASVSEGFRSGGYNIQMFGDLIQVSMKNDMMRDLANDPTLGARMGRYMPEIADNPSASSATVYKPETSWNYEVGTHLNLFDSHLTLSAALFYIMVNNQQITRFAAGNGLGRQVLNAGKSQSCGMELSASGWFNIAHNPLRLTANYGYTHATFTDYDAGVSNGENIDYDGNYLPFAPRHTFSASADYLFPIREVTMDLGVNTTGQGRIYWTEDNATYQPYYQLLGAHIGVKYKEISLTLWGRNLTGKSYMPFYFVSQGQGFAQRCRPRQFGATLSIRL